MTKKLFMLIVAFVCAATMAAQNIAVVSPSGVTTLYNTFPEAVEGAEDGSVVYLPGGKFSLDYDVNITKKITIFGIGDKFISEYNNGITRIIGNLRLCNGSSGSSLMGCYVDGNVEIGADSTEVDDVIIRYCYIKNLKIKNEHCSEIVINQNYIGWCDSWYAAAEFTNNVTGSIRGMDGGTIVNNIVTSWSNGYEFPYGGSFYSQGVFIYCKNCIIANNVILESDVSRIGSNTTNCQVSGNMVINKDWGDDCIYLTDVLLTDLFVNNNSSSVSTTNNYHFTDEYKQYENQVGIYAGTGFNDKQLTPVPYIVAKQVDEQTDAQGKLNIRVRVKAGDTE